MSDFISISDARATLPKLVNQVSNNLDRVTITVNGQPKAVLLSAEELESFEETAKIITTPGVLETIKKSQTQIRQGKYITLGQLEEKYFGRRHSVKRSRKRF